MDTIQNLIGSIDLIAPTEVCGWALDQARPTEPVAVTIFYDGVVQGVIPADKLRMDLVDAGIGNGAHSFAWPVPINIAKFSPRRVSVFVGEWAVLLGPNLLASFDEMEDEQSQDPYTVISSSGMFEADYAERFVEKRDKESYWRDPVGYFLNDSTLELKPSALFDPKWYRRKYAHLMSPGEHPLFHYLTKGIRIGLMPNFGFLPDWYLSYVTLDQLKAAKKNPLLHYATVGWRNGASPHPLFLPAWYLRQHNDIKRADIEPLGHYISAGYRESRQIHPLVETDFYRKLRGDELPVLEHVWVRGFEDGTPTHSILEVSLNKTGRASPFNLPKTLEPLEAWLNFNRTTNKRSLYVRKALNAIVGAPLLSIVMPIFNPPLNILRDAVNSALRQTYGNFELILVDDASTHEGVRAEINYLASADPRVRTIFHETNTHISRATNDAVDIARGEYIVFLDHDDSFSEDALSILAVYIDVHSRPDVLYSDDSRTDMSGRKTTAVRFKPAFSPEMLLSYSYASHLRAVKTEIYRKIGGSRVGYEGSQDHDMFLRLVDAGASVVHIPFVLYGRRALPGSTALAGDEKPYSYEAGRKAIQSAFQVKGLNVAIARPDWAMRSSLGVFRPVMPHTGPRVTIIIPTKNNARTLIRLLRSLSQTQYENYDVLIVDNESTDPETLSFLEKCPYRVERIPSGPDGFNFSRLNNIASTMTDADLLLFLNDDTEVLTPDWLSQMVGWSRLPGVGVVGARLLFADRRVQHGGVSPEQTVGYTMFRGLPTNDHGYLSSAVITRNCAAVTAACLLTPKHLFESLGGFDEVEFGVAFNDVDYCLRVWQKNLRVVYCADAELFHHEGSSRPKVDKPSEVANFKAKYGDYVDPFLNPNLDRRSNRMEIAPVVVRLPLPFDPPKVLFCSHNFNHEGAPNSLFEIVTGLHEKGKVRATVVGPQSGPLMSAYQEAGIDVVVSRSIADATRARTRADFDAACDQSVSTLSIGDYDVVFANTAEMYPLIHAAQRAGVPSIWGIREGEPWSDYYSKRTEEIEVKALEAFALPYRVIFVSEASYRNWRDLNTSRNFTTIPNGLDAARFAAKCSGIDRSVSRRRLGFADDDIVILALGGLIPRKGQHDLILSLPFLPKKLLERLQIVIVGARHNNYHERLTTIVDNYPPSLRNRVTFVQETKSVGQYYVTSDIFFCGSRVESYPRIILEAEAAGLPIITTPVAGIPEQVYQGINALFFNPGEVRKLAGLIEQLVDNKDRRLEMGKQSKIVFSSLNSYERMLKSYQTIIESAVMSSVPS